MTEVEHVCSDFRRHHIKGKYVYRCVECKRDHTSEEMREIARSFIIRPAEPDPTEMP